ncbi:MAG: hypothetical protein JAY97_03470 [Candidatus Thiodiazotropha sp. 'RUGA']|nr:hypothetical protein [Candidatus Thiodiazotropha sp. 'RUGA']
MKKILSYTIALTLFSIFISGCAPSHYKTSKILKQDNAQVAITLNKGFETTVISTNDGKRIEPICVMDEKAKKRNASVPMCEENVFSDKDNKVLYEKTFNVKVVEGSVCVKVRIGSAVYKFCDPPYDLGF